VKPSLIELIYLTITAVFFPIYIQFQGKDATTTGGLAIICLSFFYFSSSLFTKGGGFRFWLLVIVLTAIGIISSSLLPPDLTMKSIRHLGAFVCSMLLFFIVINYYSGIDDYEQPERIHGLISFVLLMGSLQIIIGIILYLYPPFGKPLSVFTPRNVDVLVTIDAGAKRLQSVMTGWEEIGEFIAVLSPLIFYQVVRTGTKFMPLFFLALYTIGVILSATRSAILLFILAGVVFIIWNRHTIRLHRVLLGSYIFGICMSILAFLFPSALNYWDAAMARFGVFSNIYSKTDSLMKAIDREGAWNYGLQIVGNNLNLFGNGMVTPGNFHCLYLTYIYELGIVGGVFIFGFFVYLLIKLFGAARNTVDPDTKCLISACIISFSVFLINEIKYEFNREFSYQEIVWLIFAIFWLVSQRAATSSQPVALQDKQKHYFDFSQ
jgi:hypothetical protein